MLPGVAQGKKAVMHQTSKTHMMFPEPTLVVAGHWLICRTMFEIHAKFGYQHLNDGKIIGGGSFNRWLNVVDIECYVFYVGLYFTEVLFAVHIIYLDNGQVAAS